MDQILSTDLHGRVGYINLPKGKVLTPTLLPVVSPKENIFTPTELYNEYNFNLIITSAYLFYKRYGIPDGSLTIHDILKFPGNVMMDSGAYQILLYGDVDIAPIKSLEIQANLKTDIGVILDVPISSEDSHSIAKKKTLRTLERVNDALDFINSHRDIIWTLPIQGGKNLDLLQFYIERITSQNLHRYFGLFALGSVAPLMSQYDYLNLFSMIYHTRNLLPHNVPLHLFGAGHPMIFPFIVALGCDMFDSAAYILFAKEGRYITSNATYKLESLSEFPCNCPVCLKWTPKELYNADKNTIIENLAKHNLYVSLLELKKIRLAINNGRLWELLELKAKSHPHLYKAFNYIVKNSEKLFWEELTPVTKFVGLKVFDDLSTFRPELTRASRKIHEDYTPTKSKLTIYVISGYVSPIELLSKLEKKDKLSIKFMEADVALFIPFFGLVPLELAESYPFSQFVFSGVISKEKYNEIIQSSVDFVIQKGYKLITIESLEKTELCAMIKHDLLKAFEKANYTISN